MKRYLLITYYWPPSGGVGVQRWLKMSNHLNDMGWKPTVFTPENPSYNGIDQKLVEEVKHLHVVRNKIIEPHHIYRWIKGSKKENLNDFQDQSSQSLFGKVSLYIRSNYFIPDARMLWIKPSIKYLKKTFKKGEFDAIISTGPPHSTHLISKGIRPYFDCPWIADFRDPWTDIDYFDELNLTSTALTKHKKLESEVVSSADKVITVSPTWQELLNDIGKRKDVAFIPNGFDSSNYADPLYKSEDFIVSHVGQFDKARNFDALWKGISTFLSNYPEAKKKFKLKMVGSMAREVKASIENYGLKEYLDHVQFVEHQEAINIMRTSSINLLLINQKTNNNKGRLPSKLYEYIAAGKPILGIGPVEGDVQTILASVNANPILDYSDEAGVMLRLEQAYKSKESTPYYNIEVYNRYNLALEVKEVLDSLTR